MSANNDPKSQPVHRDRMTVTYLTEDRPAPGPLSLMVTLLITLAVTTTLVAQSSMKSPLPANTTRVTR
jgi:hypothetical protein